MTVESVVLALRRSRSRWRCSRAGSGGSSRPDPRRSTGVLYTIPSLALFAFLVPFTGLDANDGA